VSLGWFRDDRAMTTPAVYDNSVRIGYARVSTRTQDHQAQLALRQAIWRKSEPGSGQPGPDGEAAG
jgi:hypothetical protein